MGTLNYTVGKGNRSRGQGSSAFRSSYVRTSDAFTTSTSAAFVTDGSGDITLAAGEVFMAWGDEAMWLRFGGSAATVGDGHYLPAETLMEFEVEDAGKVSAIDVA